MFTATHPHGHWMSADGNKMVTPNENLNTSTVYNFPAGAIEKTLPTGHVPIATGMMPDSSKYYVANFLDSSITVIDMATNQVKKTINLIANYNACPLETAVAIRSPGQDVCRRPADSDACQPGRNQYGHGQYLDRHHYRRRYSARHQNRHGCGDVAL